MLVTKCDICKKEIKEGSGKMTVGIKGNWMGFTFCQNCGKPVEQFLLKKRLIEKPAKIKK